MFINSLINPKWHWYLKELVDKNNLMQVHAGLFDRLMILFNVACTRSGLNQNIAKAFVEILENKKEFMVIPEFEDDNKDSKEVELLNEEQRLE